MNRERISKIMASPMFVYGVISVMAGTIFCLIYGVHILNPTYTDWLLSGGDLSQHYLGWKGYRVSKWMFPLGCTDSLAYPSKSSVIFTDSIPLFAVFFKILSPLLPEEFQYFGLWGIICFILQGIFSARIISRFTDNKYLVITASTMFCFTPNLIQRMFGHTSLAGQWLLLLALEPMFAYKSYEKKKICVLWAVVGLLAPSIHIYYVLMCGILLSGYCIEDMLAYKRLKRSLLSLSVYLLSVGAVTYLLGGFSTGVTADTEGLGEYGINLNAFFNPSGYSCIIQNMADSGRYEGFAYLGAGGIFLLAVSVLLLAGKIKFRIFIRNHWREILAFALVFLAAFAIALSPVIKIGDTVLHEFHLPGIIRRLWSVFRASGRIAWIDVYILLLCAYIMICKILDRRAAAIMLIFCTVLQIYDIHYICSEKHSRFSQIVEYDSLLEDKEFWDMIGENSEIKHVVLTQAISINELYSFTDWALGSQKAVTKFYFARSLNDAINQNISNFLSNPTSEELFIFFEGNKDQCQNYDLNYYHVDNFIVGYSGILENGQPIDIDTISQLYDTGNDE